MTFKTRIQQIWKNPLHPAWIVLAILELAVLIGCIDRFVLHSPNMNWLLAWARPPALEFFVQDINRILWGSYVVAGGIRVSEAIAAFSGKSVQGIWGTGHTMVIISMVLSYILGPALLLRGLKARKQWLAEKPAGRSSLLILVMTATGGYIVALGLLLPPLTAVASSTSFQRMKSESYVNAMRDRVEASLSVLGFQAQQLRLMPEAKGGGPWMKGPGGITIADLETVLPGLERGLGEQDVKGSLRFFLEVESPDSLTIWGIAYAHGSNLVSTFRNKDSTSGNVQVYAGVNPATVTPMVEN